MTKMTKEAITSDQISLMLQTEQALRRNEAIKNIDLFDPYWKQFIGVLKSKNSEVYSLKD